MEWYWTAGSPPGFSDLTPRERWQAWRLAQRLFWRRGPFVVVAICALAIFFLASFLATSIARWAELGLWGSALLVGVACAAAGLPARVLWIHSMKRELEVAADEVRTRRESEEG